MSDERNPPTTAELLECLEWTTSNMDCMSMVCSCCIDNRIKLVDVLKRAGVIEKPEYEDLVRAVKSDRDREVMR